ncbi:MAG: hypothetical protein JXB47_08585 [Anaerolineae bacterium]|nr:hypothetical protein [Anaerolineae bacterium]
MSKHWHQVMVFVVALGLVGAIFSAAMVWVDPATVRADATAVHIVTRSHPAATYSRVGWTYFAALVEGQQLTSYDLVDPASQPVRVLCANLTEQIITDFGPPPCPPERAVLEQGDAAVAAWQRALPEDVFSPFLITPRNTLLLSPQPIIQWNPVIGADGYRVIVRGPGVNWSADIDDPYAAQLLYPADAPALEPGERYTVEVIEITGGQEGASSADEDAAISFEVMAPEDAGAVEATVEQIEAGAPEVDVDLATAYYYLQMGLNADALAVLLAQTGDLMVETCPVEAGAALPEAASPVAYLMLGDLYLATQLEIYAGLSYSCAHDLAIAAGDIETGARSAAALARLALDDEERAEYVKEAAALWEQLGAKDALEALKAEFVGIEIE